MINHDDGTHGQLPFLSCDPSSTWPLGPMTWSSVCRTSLDFELRLQLRPTTLPPTTFIPLAPYERQPDVDLYMMHDDISICPLSVSTYLLLVAPFLPLSTLYTYPADHLATLAFGPARSSASCAPILDLKHQYPFGLPFPGCVPLFCFVLFH
jgi:hypothetical protein